MISNEEQAVRLKHLRANTKHLMTTSYAFSSRNNSIANFEKMQTLPKRGETFNADANKRIQMDTMETIAKDD